MRRAFFTLIAISAVLASSLPASVHPLAAGELPQVVTGTLIAVNTNTDSFSSGCSLRSAIQAANTDASVAGCAAGSGADTISLSDDTYTLTRTGQLEDGNQTGDLDITSDLTIQGSADISIINANHLDRVLHVANPNAHVTMLNISVQNGAVPGTDLLGGGGILNQGTLTLQDVQLTSNSARRGGGVRNSTGILVIRNSEIDNNQAEAEGGGVYADGPLTIQTSYIHGNQANTGGGVRADAALSLVDSTLEANSATYGGGLFNDATAAEVNRVTFLQNHAEVPNVAQGGGIYNNNILVLTNSTLSGNSSVFQGGGLFNSNIATSYNNTIASNTANIGGGIYNASSAARLPSFNGNRVPSAPTSARFTFANTIFYLNDLANCTNEIGASLVSAGKNVELGLSPLTSCLLSPPPADFPNTNPLLSPLSENGGSSGKYPFKTYALLPASPVMDAGSAANCTFTDQRSYTRPVDGNLDGTIQCDVGAYEYAPGGALELDKITMNVVEETAGTITLSVSRHDTPEQTSAGPIQVAYGSGGGTAKNGRDYQLVPGVLSWSAGDYSIQTFQLTVTDDPFKESQEFADIVLYNPTNGATMLSPYNKFTLVIAPSDPLGPEETTGVYLPLIAR